MKFPIELFNVQSELLLQTMAQAGEKIAANSEILFCGIVRNAGESLAQNSLLVEKMGSFFKDYSVYIYENDSTDNTLDILNSWAVRNYRVIYEAEQREGSDYVDNLDLNQYNRCSEMALCRNKYLEAANKLDTDYVCVIDLDLTGGWYIPGFFNSLFHLNTVDNAGGMTAYGIITGVGSPYRMEEIPSERYLMYDSFAYRPIGDWVSVPHPTYAQFNHVKCSPGENPWKVNSNFNGLGLYKTKAITGLEYRSRYWAENSADSEHIPFHMDMQTIKGYDLYLNPAMLTAYSQHKYVLSL